MRWARVWERDSEKREHNRVLGYCPMPNTGEALT